MQDSSNFKKIQLHQIPFGPYCYSGRFETFYRCPHWQINTDEPNQMNGECLFLDTKDFDGTSGGLLWDSIKDCGINEDDEAFENEPI